MRVERALRLFAGAAAAVAAMTGAGGGSKTKATSRDQPLLRRTHAYQSCDSLTVEQGLANEKIASARQYLPLQGGTKEISFTYKNAIFIRKTHLFFFESFLMQLTLFKTRKNSVRDTLFREESRKWQNRPKRYYFL